MDIIIKSFDRNFSVIGYFVSHHEEKEAIVYMDEFITSSYWIHGEYLPVYNHDDFKNYKEARFGNNRS